MTFPKPVLDPKSIDPMPRYSHFSGARPANSKIVIWHDLRQKKCEYLGIGSMDFGSSTGSGNVIRFYSNFTKTK
jgi:hypothetical protein